ncbi:hypothetical protein Nepgr_009357 [Nepenthes gracilis]|uniref:Uncharacterized protein n=1 Tax=Nepenthes gracilis TaxID=150966 RepID=A0AAD3SB84_NEPGR|nr:hypothetical protein Nepgr_009357 [Nepenthes gracilis]
MLTGQVENILAPPPPRSWYGRTDFHSTDSAGWVNWFPNGRQMDEDVGMEWMSWLEGSLPVLGGIDDGSGRLFFDERIA